MGICISSARSTVSGNQVSEVADASPQDASTQQGNSFARSQSATLSSLSPRSRRSSGGEFPHEVAVATSPYMDATTLARFAMTSHSTLHHLSDVQRRMDAITAAAEEEIRAFVAPNVETLDISSPALQNICELPPTQRADILGSAIAWYMMRDENETTFQASRNRFALLCQQLEALHDHPRFFQLAAQLVQNALPATYDSGEWRTVNTDEPLRQALQSIAALPMNQRRRLVDFMRTAIVHLVLPADRAEAVRALNESVGRAQRSICGQGV